MPICSQRSTVQPCKTDRIGNLVSGTAQQSTDDCRRGNPNQQYVVQANSIETVFERQNSLNLIGLDRGMQYVVNAPLAFA